MFAAIHSTITYAIRLFQGMLIGLAAMLHGVSGGVLCVAFGVYQPIMRLLADPLHTIKADLPPILPHIAGAALGFFGVAKLLSRLWHATPCHTSRSSSGLCWARRQNFFRRHAAWAEAREPSPHSYRLA